MRMNCGLAPEKCRFRPMMDCYGGGKTPEAQACEICDVVTQYWRNKTLDVFHNPVCLIECEVRTGPSCPFTRGEICDMAMTPAKVDR